VGWTGSAAPHRVDVFGPSRGGVGRADRAAVVAAGMPGAVEHVHHGHAEVHPQGVDHEEAEGGEQRQAVAGRAACRSCRERRRTRILLLETTFDTHERRLQERNAEENKLHVLTSKWIFRFSPAH